MKKWIFSLALVFSLSITDTSYQNMISHAHDVAPGMVSSEDSTYVPPSFVQAAHLSVKGMQIVGFDSNSREKLYRSFEVLEEVVNSEEFKDRVINFKNSKGERSFASNKGLSNEEIYQIFMEGRETLQQNTPGEMNFYLKLYNKSWSRVIGYTSGDTNVIHMNWKFFKNFAPHQVASNLAHEWTHKIGFDHRSAKEHDSAPYAIGYIIGEMAERIEKVRKLH